MRSQHDGEISEMPGLSVSGVRSQVAVKETKMGAPLPALWGSPMRERIHPTGSQTSECLPGLSYLLAGSQSVAEYGTCSRPDPDPVPCHSWHLVEDGSAEAKDL